MPGRQKRAAKIFQAAIGHPVITINESYDKLVGGDDELNRLLPAIGYMSKNYPDSAAISELARLCAYSERHFMRIFKKRMKVSARNLLE